MPSLRDVQHPLDQFPEVGLLPPSDPQPQIPLLASHTRQVHHFLHDARIAPSASLPFESARLLHIEDSALTSVTKQT